MTMKFCGTLKCTKPVKIAPFRDPAVWSAVKKKSTVAQAIVSHLKWTFNWPLHLWLATHTGPQSYTDLLKNGLCLVFRSNKLGWISKVWSVLNTHRINVVHEVNGHKIHCKLELLPTLVVRVNISSKSTVEMLRTFNARFNVENLHSI